LMRSQVPNGWYTLARRLRSFALPACISDESIDTADCGNGDSREFPRTLRYTVLGYVNTISIMIPVPKWQLGEYSNSRRCHPTCPSVLNANQVIRLHRGSRPSTLRISLLLVDRTCFRKGIATAGGQSMCRLNPEQPLKLICRNDTIDWLRRLVPFLPLTDR
jgi:hypothetical protein